MSKSLPQQPSSISRVIIIPTQSGTVILKSKSSHTRSAS